MKAVIYTEYGPPEVLKLAEVDKPIPKDNEVLIRVYSTSVNYGDLVARNFRSISPDKFAMPLPFWFFAKLAFGIRKPKNKIFGNEFSGVIESVGKKVTKFKEGDEIFGYTSQSMKAYAEYVTMSEDGVLAMKPSNLSFDEAAVLPYSSIMAMGLLKKIDLKKGQKILINGASGGIGSGIVQLAKSHYGVDVTGVCGTPRLDFVKALGADKVIDYTKEDFTEAEETYDFVFGGLGKSPISKVKHTLTPDGRYILTSFKVRQLLSSLISKKVSCILIPEKGEDLREAKELIEEGKIKAVIDKRFKFEEMAEAHRYIEEGNKKGHIVVQVIQQ